MGIIIFLSVSATLLLALIVGYCILCESHGSEHVWLKELAIRICYQKDRVNMTRFTRWYHLGYRQAVIFYHRHPALYALRWDHR